MEEKIKINVRKSVADILDKDMELFEFNKKDGSLNRNAFLNILIANYYESYSDKEKRLYDLIKGIIYDTVRISESDLSNLTGDLTEKINAINYNPDKDKFISTINLKPTKVSKKAIDYIEEYLLSDSSISNYFRSLFSSYSSLPQDMRERIIFKEQYIRLNDAIDRHKKVFFTTTNNIKGTEASPYVITNSKEELFNYLLADAKGVPYTYRMSRIKDVSILNVDADISGDNIATFKKMIEFGPQFNYTKNDDAEIEVALTDKGVDLFRKIYLHRPKPVRVEGNTYYFCCSALQVFNYFTRFGTTAKIIKPLALAKDFERFYCNAYHAYKKVLKNDIK